MKKIALIFLFILFSFNSFAKLNITDFNEEIEFTDFGRIVNVKIKAKVELESRNYYYKGWDYIFDSKQKIQISEAKVMGKNFKTSFGNNTLKFEFEKAFNGDQLEFAFKYLEFEDDIPEYVRQEYVSLPPFAKGANGELKVKVPDNYVVYSLNTDFKQNYKTYLWNGKIPENGFSDDFYLTLTQATWQAEVLTNIIGKDKISKIDIEMPTYFKNGNNLITNYQIKTNYDESFVKIREEDNYTKINLNKINGSIIQVKLSATLQNDLSSKAWIKLIPSDYLEIDRSLALDLGNVVYDIARNSPNEPLHIAIAKFVHKHIKYTDSYFGKELTTKEIFNAGKGVCAHYAQLYKDLLRTAGIPSIIVSGMSYDIEHKKFESHAWNLVYANGEWLSIDPTWGLYSGILPVSHIFFYLSEREIVNYTVYNANVADFSTEIKRYVKFIN